MLILLSASTLFVLSLSSVNINKNEHSDTKEAYVDIYSYCDPTPNSDIHVNNGLYYIKPFANGPVVAAICSNGYTMIDPSLDLNLHNIPSYLSSWDYSRISVDYIITNLDDTSTFREWWLPSDKDTKYRVAKDCKSCQLSSDPFLQNSAVYYTDGSTFCYTIYNDGNACTANINAYACNTCDVGDFVADTNSGTGNELYWSSCSALQVSPDTPSWHEPQMRVNKPLIYRPVMSMTRAACTCYQISDVTPNKYAVQVKELPKVTAMKQSGRQDVRDAVDYIDSLIIFDGDDGILDQAKSNNEANTDIDCENNIHYLSQSDFLYGTYRIKECGEYIFVQDVTCNFNGPTQEEEEADGFSPNTISGERLYWYPTQQQAENEYPGLYTYEGSFSLGFFTGITIECDDVVINLNGFSFSMDRRFYLQQRFFSLIELAAKPFLPNQGASTWGLTGVYYAQNAEIKGPGTIGLSSHHGIHGNNANNIYIHDINIAHFDVAGIHCNGCTYLKIENVIVGPSNNNIPTLGRYTHSRAFIPRLKDLNDGFGGKEMQFYARDVTTVSQLCQRMVNQMDMIYNNYINGIEYDSNDREWIAAKQIFQNENGWMDGGSSYGVVINGGGAAVVGVGTRITGTSNIIMENVEVFGIYNQAQEKMKFSLKSGTSRGILFDVMDWIGVTDQISDRYKSQYVGDVYTDLQFAANRYMTSWYYRNSQYIGAEEEEYVFNGNTEENDYVFLTILPILTADKPEIGGCGTDIQLHSPKGAVGLMINGALDSVFNNIYIHDVYNWAELGMDVCGQYVGPKLTTEDLDISYGYTATRAHGMVIDYTSGDYTNIHIENIESFRGEANGLTIYKESYVNLENILINNINAGTKLDEEAISNLVLPNLIPRVCPVDIHDDTVIRYINGDANDNIKFYDIFGFEICEEFEISNQDINKNSYITSIMLGILAVTISGLLIYFIYRLVQYVTVSKNEEYRGNIGNHTSNHHKYISFEFNEKTALLDTI